MQTLNKEMEMKRKILYKEMEMKGQNLKMMTLLS
jgi:hypothetical protein